MKSYRTNLGAGIAGLTLHEHDVPRPGRGEVLVRVRAASLNFRELMILRGWYPLPIKPDVVPVSDGAGEVVEIGDAVTRVAAGDRVSASVFAHWIDGALNAEAMAQLGGSLDGMLTQYALLDERALVRTPAHLSYEEAACLPCAGVTAWNALTGGRGLRPGATVLTLGSGNVSLFALKLAKACGAKVVATTSSDEKAERLRALGADEVVDYRSCPDWPLRVTEGGGGADHVVDVVGRLDQSVDALAMGGEIAYVGLLDRDRGLPPISPERLWAKGLCLRMITLGSRLHFEQMNRAIEVNRLAPVVARVFGFDEAAAAFRWYESESPFGKVVIALD